MAENNELYAVPGQLLNDIGLAVKTKLDDMTDIPVEDLPMKIGLIDGSNYLESVFTVNSVTNLISVDIGTDFTCALFLVEVQGEMTPQDSYAVMKVSFGIVEGAQIMPPTNASTTEIRKMMRPDGTIGTVAFGTLTRKDNTVRQNISYGNFYPGFTYRVRCVYF